MRKNIYLVMVFVAAMPYTALAAEPIYFPDPQLKACVEEHLGVTDPTPTDMLAISELNCASRGIVDLTGLEYATNLTRLWLQDNQISDISALSTLTNLKWLWLENNQISDISALSGLTNLLELSLHENRISDISALYSLTNLTWLVLGGNQISDISAVAGLVNLEALDLYHNQISDIPALPSLTNLTVLNLSSNQIHNISGLSSLTNLKDLTLGHNQISDIWALSGLTSLTGLHLMENKISDISPVSGLTNLTTLILDNNQATDISHLSGLTNLTILDLDKNQISDISALSGLTNLTVLELEVNQITDISALSGLTSLTYLNLQSNQISDISALSGLVNLEGLSLYNNQISDISAVSGMNNLTSLGLGWNKISDISPVAGLTNLKGLDLSATQIDNISALSGLTNLTWLNLPYNSISEISPVSGLTNLTELNLSANYHITDVSALSGLTNLARLYLNSNQITEISALTELRNLTRLELLGNYKFVNKVNIVDYRHDIPLIKRSNPKVQIFYDQCPNPLTGDLTGDCYVDMQDLQIMAQQWLGSDTGLVADLDEDGNVDFKDLSMLTENWLPRNMDWYVSPEGSPDGVGSWEDPWDLATALSSSATVRPGDTVWLAGGTYHGPFTKAGTPSGVQDAPIIYRALPGERVTLTATPTEREPYALSNFAGYVWFWGFEVIGELSQPLVASPRGVDIGGTEYKLINMVVHDWPHEGYSDGFACGGIGGEIYGCISYRNGNWFTSSQGFYSRNDPDDVGGSVDDLPWKKFTDCVAFDNSMAGFMNYADSPRMANILYEGCISFGNGRPRGWSTHGNNFYCGGRQRDDNFVMRECLTYQPPDPMAGSSAHFAYSPTFPDGRLSVENSVFIGGFMAVTIGDWEQVIFRNNVCYSPVRRLLKIWTQGDDDISQYDFNHNTYYQDALQFIKVDDVWYDTLEIWQAATGLDTNSTHTMGRPTDLWVFLRPNKYEPNRAHLIVYNWPKTETVSINFSELWPPEDNQQYEYRVANMDDIWGEPAVEGTLTGGAIEVPMTGPYAPEFSCYLVTRRVP